MYCGRYCFLSTVSVALFRLKSIKLAYILYKQLTIHNRYASVYLFVIRGNYFVIIFFFIICIYVVQNTPRRYPYFDVVVGLVWSHDLKSYAGGSECYW
jgi:hypothetical protein